MANTPFQTLIHNDFRFFSRYSCYFVCATKFHAAALPAFCVLRVASFDNNWKIESLTAETAAVCAHILRSTPFD